MDILLDNVTKKYAELSVDKTKVDTENVAQLISLHIPFKQKYMFTKCKNFNIIKKLRKWLLKLKKQISSCFSHFILSASLVIDEKS